MSWMKPRATSTACSAGCASINSISRTNDHGIGQLADRARSLRIANAESYSHGHLHMSADAGQHGRHG